MEEYKASDDFRFKVSEGAAFAYHIGSKDYLKKVKESFPEVDFSHIVLSVRESSNDQDKEEGEATPSALATPLGVIIVVSPAPKAPALADIEAPNLDKVQVNVLLRKFLLRLLPRILRKT
ncbi:hypothetical protein COCNU_09G002100 [Cocos nucifera]|uniref:Uncharacterized protein n=1 Tax=Cocos nucifera TaxID=13894 RepID=A0A8K0IJ94_COCNU|nr:hypothetical protein COCNU_09G002100 [Cocos nucifera]